MSIEDSERAERDDRTIFVSGITEKVTEPLLTELFLSAGPIERVSIPKEKEGGRNRTFGFVTYIHETSVPYALNIFAGSKLFGRELVMKYRNASKNQESPSNTASSMNAFTPNPTTYAQLQPPFITQEMIQQRLLQIATLPDFGMQSFNSFPTSISFNSDDLFPSTRNDGSSTSHAGSHRERRNDDRSEFVERSRNNHREDNRNRSRPYRRSRSRSRSPLHSRDRNRDRSPTHRRRDNNRGSGNGNGNYSRWNY